MVVHVFHPSTQEGEAGGSMLHDLVTGVQAPKRQRNSVLKHLPSTSQKKKIEDWKEDSVGKRVHQPIIGMGVQLHRRLLNSRCLEQAL